MERSKHEEHIVWKCAGNSGANNVDRGENHGKRSRDKMRPCGTDTVLVLYTLILIMREKSNRGVLTQSLFICSQSTVMRWSDEKSNNGILKHIVYWGYRLHTYK